MKSYHNKNKRAVRLWLLLPFLLMASVVEAQVTVDVRIDSLELWVGEQTRITLDVSTDTKSKLVMPQVKAGDMLTPGVEVVEVAKADTQQLNEGARRLVSQSYIVTSFDSALYYLPPLVVKVDGKEYQSKNLALRVLSIPVDTVHVDRFYGPKEIMAVPFSWTDWSLIFVLSVLLLVWVLGLAYFYIRYRDNKPIIKIIKVEPKLPPHLAAMKKIETIKADKVAKREDPKAYYTELTDVIRIYIKERFGFNAMEMTSAEIIERLLEEKDKESIHDLKVMFETADLVKFAKYAPLMNENDMNLVNAVDFINQTKIEEEPNAKKEPTEIKVEEKRSKQGRIALLCSIAITGVAALIALYLSVRHIIDLFF